MKKDEFIKQLKKTKGNEILLNNIENDGDGDGMVPLIDVIGLSDEKIANTKKIITVINFSYICNNTKHN